jgi:phage repressor protein C with HTH and peptisase S24 domain
MDKLSDRIKLIRTKTGMSQEDLAEVLGCSDGKIKGFEQGRTKEIKPKDALLLQNLYGFSQEWIMTGTGSMMIDQDALLLKNIQATVNLLDNTMQIPFYEDISASAGYGCINGDCAAATMHISISRDMVPSSSRNIDAVKVRGSSMEQTLHDGDVIFVDKNDTTIHDGKIYVVYLCDEIYVKRAFIDPKSKEILLHSDNPLFPTVKVDCDDFRIIGRVISNMQIKKL